MLSESIKSQISFVADFIGNDCEDWVKIKTEILKNVRNETRKLFSKRHKSSKKQVLNDFDREVIAYWSTLTGCVPSIPPEKVHDPEMVFNQKGWGLQELNKRRAKKTS